MKLAMPGGQAYPDRLVKIPGIIRSNLKTISQPEHSSANLSLLTQCLGPINIASSQQAGYFLFRLDGYLSCIICFVYMYGYIASMQGCFTRVHG